MSEEERANKIEEVKGVCKNFCGNCPSYTGTGETDYGFCATGKSSKITEEKGCLCPGCPITGAMSLRWQYYCTGGAARELSAAEKK
ncbi:MAG: DUF2769 domain-containing protein [Methanobacteriota archaeon]|nr:MAG: DUF2769 domain-containing protein [Euryarchaeota archaeon]